jgi:7-cyano-7-deazaguanine synthase
MIRNVLLLCSGGPDCVTLAYKLRHDGAKVTLLFIDYDQTSRIKEVEAVIKVGARGEQFQSLVLSTKIFGLSKSNLLQSRCHGENLTFPGTRVPSRNLVLLSTALSVAEDWGFNEIAIGSHAGSLHSDNSPKFIKAFEQIAKMSFPDGRPISITAPFVELSKPQIFQLGAKLGVPFHITRSCYDSTTHHCGQCDACENRKSAFELAGIEDPTHYLFNEYPS